ncbi:M28 family peptidase [Parapedobacter koreensis]|uniref:Peptidase family M28 n=1 Tax=Parapedobacter koreensis TaxID=332977 RepID=A0A1H7T0H8_9SPHI|nr:M28 family peptidase [Parapedobacter koreensis]SEL78430.1 Peptidase family M28 [Parapedobacter koreensis]
MFRIASRYVLVVYLLAGCAVHQPSDQVVDTKEVSRILNTLAADDMEGRASFTPGIERAADFIATEFNKIGLQPYVGNDYRQTFQVTRISPATWEVTFDGTEIPSNHIIVSSNRPGVNWNTEPGISFVQIKASDDFAQRFRDVSTGGKDAIVVVDPSFSQLFERYRGFMMQGRINQQANATPPTPSVVYVLASAIPQSFRVSFTNTVEELPLFNLVGMLPGKSKPNEYVIFSAHYDHIGILQPVGQDSIANGADDDASGVSAVISLANYYKKRNDNARTLLFAAFTAEELGLVGSKYFSQQLNADEVVAMINVEMIGKDAPFGPSSLYVTGYNQSNLAELMQQQVKGTDFTFHPDPYPTQNLFYRSDNASLAALGVPAHTFSTVQIDKDQYYHTVKDEVGTLNVENIASSIKALALGANGIVMGEATPTRVPKLER